MQELTDQLLEKIALRFRGLGNPVRLKILHALGAGEQSVSEILKEIGGSQANASKHLGVLRGLGLVNSRRDGVNVYYSIGDAAVFDLCELVCDSLQRRASDEVQAIEEARTKILTVGVRTSGSGG